MNIDGILPWIQVVLALLLIGAVLMQQSDAGLGVLGGGGSSEAINHTRRGAEKTLFDATIVLAVLFVLSIFVSILL